MTLPALTIDSLRDDVAYILAALVQDYRGEAKSELSFLSSRLRHWETPHALAAEWARVADEAHKLAMTTSNGFCADAKLGALLFSLYRSLRLESEEALGHFGVKTPSPLNPAAPLHSAESQSGP